MRTITLDESYFYKKVTYTLLSRNRTGIEVEAIMEGGNPTQFYFPSSWRKFKKWVN